MLATGLRLGEALGVTWADLDLTAGTVAVRRTIIRVQGKGLIASHVKSKASERGLIMPSWCVEMLSERRVHHGGFEGPVFPDSLGGWRDRSNVGRAFRAARLGSDFEWVKTHTYRKTVATLLDGSGARAHDRRPAATLGGVHDSGRLPRAPSGQRRKRCGVGDIQPSIGDGRAARRG